MHVADSKPEVRHERGRLLPPLPRSAPWWARLWRGVVRVAHGLVLHDALIAAPAMAFHFFLSLLPLLVFVGYVVGLVARKRGVEAVLSPLLDNLPEAAETLVKNEVERLAGGGGSALGPVAFPSFLWIAAGGIHGLINATENVVGTTKRPWWRKRLIAIGCVAGLLAAGAGTAYGVVRWDATMHAHQPLIDVPPPKPPKAAHESEPTRASRAREPAVEPADPAAPAAPAAPPKKRRAPIVRGPAEQALALCLSAAGALTVLAAFYRIAVSADRRTVRRVWPGALLAAASWSLISAGFALYVKRLASYATLYGSTAAVAVLLVWLWLTSLTILIGAELNAQLEGLRD